jgi:hypothetical protein
VIPIIIGVTGAIPKSFIEYTTNLERIKSRNYTK